jgi:Flp pilus assembly pilin Flp
MMITSVKSVCKRLFSDEDGATLVEYVLLVALVGVLAIVALRLLGTTATNKLTYVGNNIS